MYFGVWQVIYVALITLAVGINLAKNGEQRNDKYSFFTSLFAAAAQITILALGGFFSK